MAFFKELIVRITGDSSGLQRETQKAQGVLNKFDSSIATLGKGIAAAFSAAAIADFAKSSIAAWDESEKAANKLLAATKGNNEETQRLLKNAALMQSKTLFSDEDVVNAQIFLKSLGLTSDQIVQITPLVADFATKMGSDLGSAANIVAKTIGSSANALGRYGIEVSGAAGSSQRFQSVVAGLTKQVLGLAEAAGNAGTGSIEKFRLAIDDMKEVIGGKLSPYFTSLAKHMKLNMEAKSGKGVENYATQLTEEARAALVNAQSNEEATKILEDQKAKFKALIPVMESNIKTAKEGANVWTKMGFNPIKFHDFNSVLIENETNLKGVSKAIEDIDKQLAGGNPMSWKPDQTGTVSAGYLQTLIDAKKELEDKLPTVAKDQIQSILAQIKAKEREIRLETDKEALMEEEAKKAREIYTTTSKMIALSEQGNKLSIQQYGQLVAISDIAGAARKSVTGAGLPAAPGPSAVTMNDPMQKAIQQIPYKKPVGSLQGYSNVWTDGMSKNLPVITSDLEKAAKAQEDYNKYLEKTAFLSGAVSEELSNMGGYLAQGADNWQDFGKMALNALRGMVAGLIAKGIASAVEKSLSELPVGVGLAVGAATGGLAAGLFNTLIPSFADGGFVKSPTLAMVGDNPSGKGEFIIPADKMGGGFIAETRVSGRDLAIILSRESNYKGRV